MLCENTMNEIINNNNSMFRFIQHIQNNPNAFNVFKNAFQQFEQHPGIITGSGSDLPF